MKSLKIFLLLTLSCMFCFASEIEKIDLYNLSEFEVAVLQKNRAPHKIMEFVNREALAISSRIQELDALSKESGQELQTEYWIMIGKMDAYKDLIGFLYSNNKESLF